MFIIRIVKRQTGEGTELPNQERIRTLREKKNRYSEYWKRTLSNKRR